MQRAYRLVRFLGRERGLRPRNTEHFVSDRLRPLKPVCIRLEVCDRLEKPTERDSEPISVNSHPFAAPPDHTSHLMPAVLLYTKR